MPPPAAFTLGTQVGVPSGTVLTDVSGGSVLVGTADGTESLTLTHPVTGAQSVRTVSVWRRKRWTSTPVFKPASGATWLFDECEFDVELDNWCAEVDDTNSTSDIMQPLAVFRRCTFEGNSSTSRALLAGFSWVLNCHLHGTEDAWGGAYYSVAVGSNFIPTEDGGFDPHQDGVQIAGIGQCVLYHCFCSAGSDPIANSAVRLGTDFSRIENVGIYYSTLDHGGWTLQVRGERLGLGVDALSVVGCRWVDNNGFGPCDFEGVTNLTWIDNAYHGGAAIPSPV